MLINDQAMLKRLRSVVWSLAAESSLHDDMLQEAIVHLWRLETERSDQTPGWYVQGCRFHLQHYLAAGRSLDSLKRRRTSMVLFQADEDAVAFFDQLTADTFEFDQMGLRDLVNVVSRNLTVRERAVLECLAEGRGAIDISRKLRLSVPTVCKYRRKIASLVIKLGSVERHLTTVAAEQASS